MFLNSYLSRIGPVIREHHGYIDKFLGDGVLAVFPERPADAVQAVIALADEISTYNRHRRASGYAAIRVGYGLHSGQVMLGTIGDRQRMDGTVISDAVNLASRLEGATKTFGAAALMSNIVRDSAPAGTPMRCLGRVRVIGKQEALEVHELLIGEDARAKHATGDEFAEALRLYRGGDPDRAARLFESVLAQDPADQAARYYLVHCRRVTGSEGLSDWDGAVVLDTK